MGVLSLHNECPPLDYGPDAEAICHGLLLGEEGTSALLRALGDCMNALAAMDDTVGNIVNAFAGAARQANGNKNGPCEDPGTSYARFFDCISETDALVDTALTKYRAWGKYAQGVKFKLALERASGDDFDHLVARRIELLRKLGVRIKVMKQLSDVGDRMFRSYDYPGFFNLFMAPVRDIAIAANELYSEVVRGALASHQAFFQVCVMQGENQVDPNMKGEINYPAGNGRAGSSISARPDADQFAGSATASHDEPDVSGRVPGAGSPGLSYVAPFAAAFANGGQTSKRETS
jgi:hypothetical protein